MKTTRRSFFFVTLIISFSIVLIFISYQFGRLEIENSRTEQEIKVLMEVSTIASKLEGKLQSTFNLTSGIVNLVKHQGGIEKKQFDALSIMAMMEDNNLLSITLAPNNIVTMICPLERIKTVIGLNYMENEEQRPSILKAMELKQSLLVGPVRLVGGGTGFINRTPIFIEDMNNHQERYWGVISTVAHMESILEDAGITTSNNLMIAMKADEWIFVGDSSIVNNNPVSVNLNLKTAQWKLLAMPTSGWDNRTICQSKYFWICIVISSLLILSLSLVIYSNRKVRDNNILLATEIAVRKQIETELIEAKDAAEKANSFKSIFLADMSHEIRSPMNSILGFTELIMSGDCKDSNIMSHIEIINSSAKRLLTIINGAIDISMIESGKMLLYFEQASLNEIMNNVIKLNEIQLSNKNISIITDFGFSNGSDLINTDENRLIQVINNLITNAIKFSNKGSVTVGYIPQGEELKFFVTDTGAGIPAEVGNSIFERFIQVDGKISTKIGGSGLGLSICKAIVEKMGGKIWYESQLNVGTTFYFTIPYPKKSVSSHNLPNKVAAVDLSTKTILVVDDDESNRFLIEAFLKATKVNVIMATNGQQAIDIVSSQKQVDLIMMDIKMPGLDGYETTQQIRRLNSNVPIIAQSAFTMTNNHQKALDAGCNYYITKPIDIQAVLALLHKLLG